MGGRWRVEGFDITGRAFRAFSPPRLVTVENTLSTVQYDVTVALC